MKKLSLTEATCKALEGKLIEDDRMNKLQNIVNRRNQDNLDKEYSYLEDINDVYDLVDDNRDRINEDIKLFEYAYNNKLIKDSGFSRDDNWWEANAISHHIGFCFYERTGCLGILGGGAAGPVGVLYTNNKLYLFDADKRRIVIELNQFPCSIEDLSQYRTHIEDFARFCNIFSKGLIEFLDKFEKFIDEELQ